MKRTVRLVSLLVAALLLLAACSSAQEAGEEATQTEAAAPVVSEPPAVETEALSEPATSPGTETEASGSGSDQSILEIASENPQLAQLVAALEAAGLTDELERAGPITLFAPNNEAFAALDQADLQALLADPSSLGDILQYHVVEGSYPASELSDGQTLTTLQGSDLTVSMQGGTVTVGDAEVVQPDAAEASNGVIHIIDGVLQP
jgi:uncharacterized surface protein with fasciclin (FAS1) repeats